VKCVWRNVCSRVKWSVQWCPWHQLGLVSRMASLQQDAECRLTQSKPQWYVGLDMGVPGHRVIQTHIWYYYEVFVVWKILTVITVCRLNIQLQTINTLQQLPTKSANDGQCNLSQFSSDHFSFSKILFSKHSFIVFLRSSRTATHTMHVLHKFSQ